MHDEYNADIAGAERVCAEVSLSAIRKNYQIIRNMIPRNTGIMAVVKADAYGHGAVPVTKTLALEGADWFGVAVHEEGGELREAGVNTPILVLGHTLPQSQHYILDYKLTQTIFDYESAVMLSDLAVKQNKTAEIHVKIDTGMSRLGFSDNEASAAMVLRVAKLPNMRITGIYTHFACSDSDDDFTELQFERFMNFIDRLHFNGLDIPLKHISNSGSISRCNSNKHEYSMDLIRPGIMLYGYSNIAACEPALSWKARIGQLRMLDKGVSVGYGRNFFTGRESRVAAVTVGYADGYSRLHSNKGRVIINGCFAPVVGNVCMDQMIADVSDVPDIESDSEVILIGSQNGLNINANDLAAIQGTIPYEVLCGISKRVKRIYLD